MKITSIKDQYQQEKLKYENEIKKIKEKRFNEIDDFVENTNPKIILKIILKILLYILKKI